MKILFLVPYPTAGPSNRYRVEQYLPYLKEEGFDYALRPFLSDRGYQIFYKQGHFIEKAVILFLSSLKRIIDSAKICRYDAVFVHIESFPIGPPLLEELTHRLKKSLIFDFEDAIYLPPSSSKSALLNFLKFRDKFYRVVKLSKSVIVCNEYLKGKLIDLNNNITVIPTSIDTERFKPRKSITDNTNLTIGWIGSPTTSEYLKGLKDVFERLACARNFTLKLIGGKQDIKFNKVNLISHRWSLATEVEDFQSLDIGVYPLPDDEYGWAKTPFKTIQYMSVGVPLVASKVGGNRHIIKDGINGFLASSNQEWFDKLLLLIDNAQLRYKIGYEGRKTVEEGYSLKINAPRFLKVIKEACN